MGGAKLIVHLGVVINSLFADKQRPRSLGPQDQRAVKYCVVNDVDAALLGEAVLGAAKNAKSAYCVALGTGIFRVNAYLGKVICNK